MQSLGGAAKRKVLQNVKWERRIWKNKGEEKFYVKYINNNILSYLNMLT